MNPIIYTSTGKQVNPLDLKPEDICIEDIAHALACCNRFAGHTRKPVSVAQHSVYVSRLCPGHDLQALLHDASEAYLGDVTKWLKQTPAMKGYREAEERAQRTIYEKFGCCWTEAPAIEEADRIMVRVEGGRTIPGFLIDHPRYPPLTRAELDRVGKWTPWNWKTAEEVFLAHFRMLTCAA